MTGIDFNQSEQHILSIRLSANGFSFSIHHPSMDGIRYYMPFTINPSYSMTANLKEMLASSEALKRTYKKVNVLIDTPRFTLVPFELFEDEQQDNLFYENFQFKDNEIVLCNILGKSNTAILFGMDKHTHQLINESFPQARIYAGICPLTEYFTQESRSSNCRKLYVHLKQDAIEVCGLDKGKLQLINTFSCKQISDQVYYLLYIWQQLGFNQENDELYLAGDLLGKEQLLEELRKFLRKVSTIAPIINELPFDMQTLLICE